MTKIEQIKQFMKANKITYDKLAAISGVPKRTLADIFCGATKNPRIDTMQAIERALGIDSSYTFNSDNSPEAIAAALHAHIKQAMATAPSTDETSKTVRGFLKFNFWERLRLPKAFRKLLKEHDNVIFLDKYIDGNDKIYEGYFWLDRSADDKIAVIGENLDDLKRDFISTVNERFSGGEK